MRRLLAAAVLLAGCGDNKFDDGHFTPQDAPPHPMIDAPGIDGPPGPRGPNAYVIPGVAYGAFWDNTAQALYITDDTNNRLIKWTDAGGFTTFGAVPTGTTANQLGAIVQLADKSFYVPSQNGALYSVSADGTTNASLTGLTNRRRVGLALDPSGVLYDTFFAGTGTMTPVGGLASVAVTGTAATETVITTSVALKKVTGLVATATYLYVCDQTAKKIYKVTIADGTTTTFSSVIPSCDQIFVMTNGDFITGGLTGGVYRLKPDGTTITSIVSGLDQIRGLAYDPTLQRLFVVENRTQQATMPLLHVLPLD